MEKREIKFKNPFLVYFFIFASFGIYGLVWQVKAKRDLNSLGADIPTSWLLLLPLANMYWVYKFVDGYTQISKKGSTVGNFLLFAFLPVAPYFVQSLLNEHVSNNEPAAPISHAQAA